MPEPIWSPKKQKVSDLKLWDQNPRQIGKAEYERLKKRITERGFHDVIKVDTDNIILSGNQRRRALEELGVKEVWTMIPDRPLTEEERNAVALESNRNDGNWDWDQMANFDLEFLKEMGFDDKELAKGLNLQLDVQEDEAPEPRPDPNVKLGDLFQLGNHRLLCGDATKKEDVERLMDGQKADMVFTDPPYNVDYKGGTKDALKIDNDSMSSEDFRAFLTDVIYQIVENCKGSIYVCMSSSEWPTLHSVFAEVGGYWSRTIIWVKDRFVLSRGDYHTQFEPIAQLDVAPEEGQPILYGWAKGVKHQWNGGRKQSDVWRFDKPAANREHPTMKPVSLCARAISNSSTTGQSVLDPFGGSGSTLIAAEQLGRKCYMMEIDPQYVRVIIDRWEKLTGNKAVKL